MFKISLISSFLIALSLLAGCAGESTQGSSINLSGPQDSVTGTNCSNTQTCDDDKDGVSNLKDMCKRTPPGTEVDDEGCPKKLDSDEDSVYDDFDNCPDTPTGVAVDEFGCMIDSDKDGVADSLDQCLDTEAGVSVDENGCEDIDDADKDGVENSADDCPNTPNGADVDADGCPLDDDNDGVANYLDRCLNTKSDVLVDDEGCEKDMRILVFTEIGNRENVNGGVERGYEHPSIPKGVDMLEDLANDNGWLIDVTDSSSGYFSEDTLKRYAVVVWLSTTEDVLNRSEQDAFKSYMENGGGYVGIHAASDCEYAGDDGGNNFYHYFNNNRFKEQGWGTWYRDLVGAQFKYHPADHSDERLVVEDRSHPSTSHLGSSWVHRDEWYEFRTNPRDNDNISILLSFNRNDNPHGGGDHPLAWFQEIGEGRAFYTALGHRDDTYSNSEFIKHIEGGIKWSAMLQD